MEIDWPVLVLEILDYFIQVLLVVLSLVYPWIVVPTQWAKVVMYPLILSFFWTLWRLYLFDDVIQYDVPGIGYLFIGVIFSIVGGALYGVRTIFSAKTARENRQGKADAIEDME